MTAALVVICLFIFCGTSHGNQASEEKVSDGANCFTLKLYQQLAKTNENLVSSPFSLDVLLSMLYTGAGGETAQELSTYLGYNGLSVEDVENAFQNKLGKLNSRECNTLEIANSIWIQIGFEIKQSFKNIVANKFYSEEKNVDFQHDSHGATKAINTWGNEKSHCLIPILLSEDLDPSTLMCLVNAIYFKGEWAAKFPKQNTYPGEFKNNDSSNSPTTVQLMRQQTSFLYHLDTTLGAEVLEMNYVGDNFSMVLLLPQEGSNIESLENALTCETFKSGIISSSDVSIVDVTMPQFELSSSFDLVKPIKDMGIKNVFEGADFSGISPDIGVSQAIQKAIIKVYEEGSEAAALTEIAAASPAPGPPPAEEIFSADHPFLFLIRDKRTDLILFLGRVKNLPNAA